MELKGKRIMVTGGAGFIGSHFVDQLLLRDPQSVFIVDDMSNGRMQCIPVDARVSFTRMDLRHEAWDTADVDVVVQLASAVTGIAHNNRCKLQMLQDNLRIYTNVVEQLRLNKPELYIYVSTACVYPHYAPVPTPERWGNVCDPEPTNWGYGVAKWVGEAQAKLVCSELDVPTMIVRFFNAIGPRDHYEKWISHVTPALIRRVWELDRTHAYPNPEELIIWGSGNQKRVFVDARDIARILLDLAEIDEAHDAIPINIGHSRMISINELAEMVINAVVCDPASYNIVPDMNKPEGYPLRAADTTRLEGLIGTGYEWIPLAKSITDMVLDYKRQRNSKWIRDL